MMMMTMTTYPTTPEKPVTRAEIDRLTKIIARLHDHMDTDAVTIRRLRYEIDVQVARTAVCEAFLAQWRVCNASRSVL